MLQKKNIYLYCYTMNLSLILFTIGILGFVLNRKNIILMLISIEIMLLAITFLILVSSLSFDDILGQTYAIYIIAIAGAESAIGLGILVAFYRFTPLKSTRLLFSSPLAQDLRDLSLLESFVYFFECGYVAKYKNRLVCEFIVTKIDYTSSHIIPFFEKYNIKGSKYTDYLDFKSAALIIKNNKYLKQDGIGLNKILQLKNKNRDMV